MDWPGLVYKLALMNRAIVEYASLLYTDVVLLHKIAVLLACERPLELYIS